MTGGSGPAGEITMDDIRRRLASVSARLTAMRDREPITAIGGSVSSQPGRPAGTTEGHGEGQ